MEGWSLVGCWRRVLCNVSESHIVFMFRVKWCKKSVWPLSRRLYDFAKLWEPLIKRYIVTSKDTNRLRYRWENLTSCKERRGHRSCVNGHVTGLTDLRAKKRKNKITKNCSPIITLSQPNGHYMYRQFNIQQFYVLPTQCIYVLCVDLRTNSDYFSIQH
jgi:hypothetical protein